MVGYLDKPIKPLVLTMHKMSGYVKTSKVKEGDKDKNKKTIHKEINVFQYKRWEAIGKIQSYLD